MRLTDPDLQAELTATAHALADAARLATLKHFRTQNLDADNKEANGFDPVTIADREAETAMRAVLAERRPDDGIYGEEYGRQTGTSGLTWVLDPVDGTRAFLAGAPTWGVLIAVGDAAGPCLGLIDQPFIGERFIGGFGHAETVGPMGRQPLVPRAPRPLHEAILCSTFPEVGTELEREAFHALAAQTRLTRYGLDCYGYALVATGHVDLVVEAGLAPYDIQGPLAVIQAAGGVVTDWQGRPAHEGGRVIAAGNAEIHAAALAQLSRAPENS